MSNDELVKVPREPTHEQKEAARRYKVECERTYKATCVKVGDRHGERDACTDIEVLEARLDELNLCMEERNADTQKRPEFRMKLTDFTP